MAKLIGEILVEKKLVSPDELNRALVEHEKTGEPLGATLTRAAPRSAARFADEHRDVCVPAMPG